jgi:hypothetical protein
MDFLDAATKALIKSMRAKIDAEMMAASYAPPKTEPLPAPLPWYRIPEPAKYEFPKGKSPWAS